MRSRETNKERDLSQSSGERRNMQITLKVRGAMLALPTASSGERRNQPSEWEGTQTLRKERHTHRWPSLVRGAVLALPMRSSKSGELIPQSEGTQTPRRERHAHKWPSMVRGAMLALPTASSGGRNTHSPEWEGTQTPIRERHAHKWPSVVRGAMLARPTRRATYHRALGSGETQTLRVRGNSDAQKGAVC